jgi:Tol biopolymer transport system component
MNTKRLRSLWAVLAVAALAAVLTGPASGTFPGKNGRIAFIFAPANPAGMFGNVYTMNPSGSGVRQITSLPPNTNPNSEAWSPDGRQIVFGEFPPQNALGQLWLVNADGSNLHLLLSEPSYYDNEPSFSPDGSTIVFARCPTSVTLGCAIYRIQTDGTGLTAITNFKPWVSDFRPWYSPDGRTIAFGNVGRGGILLGIYLVNSDGSNVRLLTPPWIGGDGPSWSPDGRKIAFSSNGSVVDHSYASGLNEEIWVINTDGTGLTRLTHTNEDWHGYLNAPHDTFPSWSPDGSAITFARLSPSLASSAIYVMNADGSGLRQILNLPGPPPGAAGLSASGANGGPTPFLAQHLKPIEMGGVEPQWGPAPQ